MSFRRPIHAGFALLVLALLFVARLFASCRACEHAARAGAHRDHRDRRRQLVWLPLSRPPRRLRRSLRHAAAHRRASHAALSDLGRGHESLQWKTSGRAHQRSRPLRERTHPRSLASRRARHRHAPRRNRSRAPEGDRPPAIEPQQPVDATAKPAPAPPVALDSVPDPPALLAPAPTSNWFAVQAGAFSDRDRAESLRATLADHFMPARVVSNTATTGAPTLWRVIVGHEMTRDQAAELAIRVRQETGAALVVAEPAPVPCAVARNSTYPQSGYTPHPQVTYPKSLYAGLEESCIQS